MLAGMVSPLARCGMLSPEMIAAIVGAGGVVLAVAIESVSVVLTMRRKRMIELARIVDAYCNREMKWGRRLLPSVTSLRKRV